ncbi:MAG TPA: PLP-dependent aminotransferase family protein, partial [Gemmatimonadaceae bacterium]|nr:PLP-dependent aminotransferase family protein [Gemmatimonadaceae bacterium]
MDLHIALTSGRDLSQEIYRQIRSAISEGRLRAGDRLPSSRELGHTLNVARMTVIVAYERLAGEGFVATRVGAGTFVTSESDPQDKRALAARGLADFESTDPALVTRPIWNAISFPSAFARPARFDFRSGLPDVEHFPHRAWRRAVTHALDAEVSRAGVYAQSAGHPALRAAIAAHIGTSRGVRISADDVTITGGTQQALDLIVRVLLEPGDRVAIEDPGYMMARRLFASHEMSVIGVPVDNDGLVVDAIPDDVRLVYVTPSHQYPTGVSMPFARRSALLSWADRHDAVIVEDDYDSEFRFGGRPIDALQALDARGRVIYVASFSKTMLPTLRVGFVVAPPALRVAIRKARLVSDWHGPTLIECALARFIETGDFARHLRRMRRVYAARRKAIIAALSRDFSEDLAVAPSEAGLHVSAFARRLSAEAIKDVAQRAADMDVAVQELAWFARDVPPRPGLVIGYGAIDES